MPSALSFRTPKDYKPAGTSMTRESYANAIKI